MIMSAAGLSLAMMFCALILEVSRGAIVRESLEQAAYFSAKAGAIAWHRFEGDEFHTIRTVKKYYNANIPSNLDEIQETGITVNGLSRRIEVRVSEDVEGLFSFIPSQNIRILVESPY